MNRYMHPILDLHFAFPVTSEIMRDDDEDETQNPYDEDNLPLEDEFGDDDFPSEDEDQDFDDEFVHVMEEGDEEKDNLLDGQVPPLEEEILLDDELPPP